MHSFNILIGTVLQNHYFPGFKILQYTSSPAPNHSRRSHQGSIEIQPREGNAHWSNDEATLEVARIGYFKENKP